MTIQGMREGVKKHKILIGILFVLLIASLLITYSVSGLRNASLGAGQGADYSGFEKAVAQQRATAAAFPCNNFPFFPTVKCPNNPDEIFKEARRWYR